MIRICGECKHYMLGHLEMPCNKGNRLCGYLVENKACWESPDGSTEEARKICKQCGKSLPLKMYYMSKKTKDNLTDVCKLCRPHSWYKSTRK